MSEWEEAGRSMQAAIAELRGRMASAIMIFLGAGLSVGVGLRLGRATPRAESHEPQITLWA